ncbi:MAG: TauD/TfdA family dioxygenase [Sphingomonadaceae bacterium]|nr:TauD/TfdA family dioxygenase [Sphingomonadaceae bacterium]
MNIEAKIAQSLTVTPRGGTFAAEITGVTLADRLNDDGLFAELRALLTDHLVLFLPGQHLSAEAMCTLASRFGELNILDPSDPRRDAQFPSLGRFITPVPGKNTHNYSDMWHADFTYQRVPEAIAMFQLVETPRRGGDTLWSNQYAAFEALSHPIKELARTLTGVHVFKGLGDTSAKPIEHPIVCRHPHSGREHLYVTSGYLTHIPQLRRKESMVLLDYLREISAQPEFTVRRSHRPGDVVIWDNRCTLHYGAHDYDPHDRRELWRIGALDNLPIAAAFPERIAPHFDFSAVTARLV